MSWALGRKDAVSKSWSDLWDEEEEEEEEAAKQLEALKQLNSRTWSHESKTEVIGSGVDNDDTPRLGLSPASKSASIHKDESLSIAAAISDDIDADLISDGFFFHDAPPAKAQQPLTPYSPPSKRDNLDKWAALGQRRRAVAASSDSAAAAAPETPSKSENRVGKSPFASMAGHADSNLGEPYTPLSLPLTNVHNLHSTPVHNTVNPARWTPHAKESVKDRPTECPWSKGKARERGWTWSLNNWRKEKRDDSVVGGVGW